MVIIMIFLLLSCSVKKESLVCFCIRDSLTLEAITSMSQIKLLGDTIYVFNVTNFSDTCLCKNVLYGKYSIEVSAVGYNRFFDTVIFNRTEDIQRIEITSIMIDSVKIDWDDAYISIIDSNGRFFSVKHKVRIFQDSLQTDTINTIR